MPGAKYNHIDLGPNCPDEDQDCAICPERAANGCLYYVMPEDHACSTDS